MCPHGYHASSRSGYTHKLEYKPRTTGNNKDKRKRSRNITWYNPPFDLSVKTNVGRAFLNIIDSSFPVDHMLRTIFNRSTLKLSYSCLPNIKNTINSHNKAQLKKSDTEAKKDCNCRNKANCPLTGNCREHNIVYQATVTTRENDNNRTKKNTESYVGLTENEFKKRFANHKQSFTNPRLRNATELSKYIWSLKEKNTEYDIAWRILGKAESYTNRTKRYNLCNLEKFHIICHQDKATLNKKSELVNHCLHAKKFLLKNAYPP